MTNEDEYLQLWGDVKMSNYREFSLAGLAARTVTGSGSEVVTATPNDTSSNDFGINVYLNVTAHAGTTPTLTVEVLGVVNGADHVLATFTTIGDANSVEFKRIINPPAVLKAKWTIGGSAGQSYTFSVDAVRY